MSFQGEHQKFYICRISLMAFIAFMLLSWTIPVFAQFGKPIVIQKSLETLEERFQREITLDVREMNIVDVIKFLSVKGDFNMVTSGTIEGRVTLYLKNVSIADAFDILLIANNLAYYVENGIVQVMPAVEYETMFGKKFNDKLQVAILSLNYAKPQYVISALESIRSELGKIIIDEDTGSVVLVDTPQAIKAMQQAILEIEKPADVFVYTLQYAKADVVAEKVSARLEEHKVGTVTTDERSNKLLVRAFPGRRQEVEGMIKALDVPTKEVLIEARVLQITLKPKYDMGIDWQLNFKDSNDKEIRKLSFNNVYLDENNLATSDNLSSLFGKIAVGDINKDAFQLSLRALKQVSDTKILSNPKLLVINNEEARIHVGDTVPYIISTTSGTGDNAITSEDVRFVDVGLKLDVTPTINDEGYVMMRLKPEISTVVGSITSQGGGIPQVNKTEVETTVMVKDGTTIILGGLKRDNKVHSKKGFPFLMDLPVFDKFFSRVTDSMEKTEIVIFITPHIVMGGHEQSTKSFGDIKPSKQFEEEQVEELSLSTDEEELKDLSLTIKE